VKRVHLDWAERQIIAVSDNELYRPKAIDLDEDRPLGHYLLGRVIWVGKEDIWRSVPDLLAKLTDRGNLHRRRSSEAWIFEGPA
jgi:hypothetical protein